MDKKTLEALKKCIEKYEKYVEIAKGAKEVITYYNRGKYGIILTPSACPLCDLFFNNNCRRCPIKINTGSIECGKTPYMPLSKYFLYEKYSNYKTNRRLKKLLQAEVDFLKSLLPEEVLGG